MRKFGTQVFGLRCGVLKQGDDLIQIVVDTVLNSGLEIKDRDVLGITESIVARCEGNYVTIDEVAEEIKKLSHNAEMIAVCQSSNRQESCPQAPDCDADA